MNEWTILQDARLLPLGAMLLGALFERFKQNAGLAEGSAWCRSLFSALLLVAAIIVILKYVFRCTRQLLGRRCEPGSSCLDGSRHRGRMRLGSPCSWG